MEISPPLNYSNQQKAGKSLNENHLWLGLFHFVHRMSWAHSGPVSAGSFPEQRLVIEPKGAGTFPETKKLKKFNCVNGKTFKSNTCAYASI